MSLSPQIPYVRGRGDVVKTFTGPRDPCGARATFRKVVCTVSLNAAPNEGENLLGRVPEGAVRLSSEKASRRHARMVVGREVLVFCAGPAPGTTRTDLG